MCHCALQCIRWTTESLTEYILSLGRNHVMKHVTITFSYYMLVQMIYYKVSGLKDDVFISDSQTIKMNEYRHCRETSVLEQ